MTIVVTRGSCRFLMLCAERILFVVAALMLGYCAFQLAESWTFQNREAQQFEQLRNAPAALNAPAPRAIQGLVGRLDVERLGISVVVMEGSDERTLRHAAGHIAGTGLPGHAGNIGISAHRDTFFRPLKDVRLNDRILLTTLAGEYRYRVVSTRVVDPYDVEVLNPARTEVLTLVTCFPFYFVGAAPERFIVRAERIG